MPGVTCDRQRVLEIAPASGKAGRIGSIITYIPFCLSAGDETKHFRFVVELGGNWRIFQRGPTALQFTPNWLEAWVISEGSKCITLDSGGSPTRVQRCFQETRALYRPGRSLDVKPGRGEINPASLTDYNLVFVMGSLERCFVVRKVLMDELKCGPAQRDESRCCHRAGAGVTGYQSSHHARTRYLYVQSAPEFREARETLQAK